MKNFILGFLTMSALLVFGSWGYLTLGLAEVRDDVNAPAWENRFMNLAVHASVQRRVGKVQNPLPPTDETLVAGGKLYLDGCTGCHGEPGKTLPLTKAYYVPAPRFELTGTSYPEPELFWIVKHGIRRTEMSAYGPFYTDQQIWSLASFVKRMNSLSPSVLKSIQPGNP
jgi:mono/diheme cytochrome c family protein